MTKNKPKTYTKPELIAKLKEISAMGFIPNARRGNAGGIDNTLEDLLGIKENNLPIPNAAEWELKAQRLNSTSLTTLFHIEPSPRAIRFVPQVLLPKIWLGSPRRRQEISERRNQFPANNPRTITKRSWLQGRD